MKKPTLCLDFDGVIHSYKSPWQGADVIPDDPVPGAIEFICRAAEKFQVCIFSSRSHQEGGIDAMVAWLLKHGLPGRVLVELDFPTVKPPAQVTIDDRAITFNGAWPSVETLLAFKPWNKWGT